MIEIRNRLTIRQDWVGRGIVVRFPAHGRVFEVPHETLIEIIRATAPYLETRSWLASGEYSTAHPNKRLVSQLSAFEISR